MSLDFLKAQGAVPLVIAAAAVVLAFLFRRPAARLVIRFTLTRLRRRNPDRYKLVRDGLLRPVSYMFFTGIARIAIEYMGIPEKAFGIVANIVSSLFMVTAFWALYAAAGFVAVLIAESTREKGNGVSATAANYVSGAIRIVIVVVGVLMVLSRWVSDISGLIAGLGIGGLAIALAAQDTAANLFGSISIMLDKPFEIGDWVEAEGVEGTVEKVGFRSSRIRAFDQSVITIPNSKLANSTISNGTNRVRRRITFRLGLVYSTPPKAISDYIERIKAVLEADPDVENESAMVFFENFADSTLEIFVSYHTVVDYITMMRVRERINLTLLEQAKEAGVSMAFPSVSVYREN
ncbi:MAG: mechanosensitive ion channel family protein [Christensenellales bacterium]|jgi:MscS family membrane protein